MVALVFLYMSARAGTTRIVTRCAVHIILATAWPADGSQSLSDCLRVCLTRILDRVWQQLLLKLDSLGMKPVVTPDAK